MTCLNTGYEPNGDMPRKLPEAMLRIVQRNYGRLIAEARREWERRFAGGDPSDACVTVRISSGDSRNNAPDCFRSHSLAGRTLS